MKPIGVDLSRAAWRLDHGELDGLHPRVSVLHIGTNNTSDTEHARKNTPAEITEGEALPLHELGRLEITRSSNIEFNNTTQQWEVKDQKGKVRFIAKSRSACLEWEEQNLQPQ